MNLTVVVAADPATVSLERGQIAELLSVEEVAGAAPERVLQLLGTGPNGLDGAEVADRVETYGPNAVRTHHTSVLSVLARQVGSPLLWLLVGAAVATTG
jgi:Mg2+-importing ATPase